MTRVIFATPPIGWPRRLERRRAQLRAAEQLGELADIHFEWGKKFAVVIRDRDKHEDFRLCLNKRDALLRFYPAALAAALNTSVSNGNGGFFRIAGAWVYEVDCDNEETARRSINESQARLIADSTDTMGAPDLVVSDLFEPRH